MKPLPRDVKAIIVLILAVLVLFLPALTGYLGIFHDDLAMVEFPWHFFLARHIQNGVIPLWEPDTWCGAIPFYARYYADTYYFLLWPFYFLSRTGDLEQTYRIISLLPLLMHYCLAGAGMYLLARRGIRLGSLSAFVTAWVYLFSPAFAYSYVWFPIVVVQAWLPWLLLVVVLMDRRPGLWKVGAGGCIIALMVLAAQPPHAGYSMFLTILLALALAVRRLRRGEKRMVLRAPLQFLGAALLGLALSAVFWVSVLDGAAHTEQHLPMTYKSMTGGDGSMPPVYLATLFVPDLFGTVTGFNNRNWVEAVTHGVRFWDANMSGGLLLTFLALAGAVLIFKRKGRHDLRFWAILAGLVWVFSILCMLGRHTPFYYLFYRLVPVLSNFPFPIRYRMLQVIATAWLAGLGMEYVTSGERAESGWPARFVWGYFGLAALTFVFALAGPRGLLSMLSGRFVLPGLDEIINHDNWRWFIFNPVLYFLATGFCLVLAWRGLRGKARAFVVAGLVILEMGLMTGAAFYFCIFRFHEPQPQQLRSLGPSVHPMVQRILGPLTLLMTDTSLRWATDQPFHDDFARLEPTDSYAFMGYDMKPLEKRFKKAFEAAYQQPVDWPLYWEFPRPIFPSFLSNMSVGCLLDSRPESIFSGGETVKLESGPDFYLHQNPLVMPRAFTMDRIVICSDKEQMNELINGDLRRGVFLEDGKQLAGLIMDYESFNPGSEREYVEHFDELQAANRIIELDLGNPNRVEVAVHITRPVMLVLTEVWYPGWEAKVDGEPAHLYRVNYLQRGVWLDRGKHRVEMVFRPLAWRIGAIVSAASWCVLILIFLGWGVRRLVRRGSGNRRLRWTSA